MKFKRGELCNMEGDVKDIIVDSKNAPIKGVDLVIGGALLISGVTYLMSKAFRCGAKAFEQGEFNTMVDLKIIDPLDNGKFIHKKEYGKK